MRTSIRIPTALPLLLFALLAFPAQASAFDWLKQGQELLGGSAATSTTSTTGLSDPEIAAGLKEALKVGTERVVTQLGAVDGFNADPQIHIPLPASLQQAQGTLQRFGMSGLFDDLELKLNRAAEAATPEAKALFVDAIGQMTLEDVQRIYQGPDDAATRYFEEKMSAPLAEKMRPLVEESLSQVGAVQAYDSAMSQYRSLPFVPDLKADLTRQVIDGGLEGIFYYLAREEAAIRENPAKRTTELLQQVFGAK